LLYVSPGVSQQPIIPTAPFLKLGDGSLYTDPFYVEINTYYGFDEWEQYFNITDTRYITFDVQQNEVFYVYIDPSSYWDLELFGDSNYTTLLGTPCSSPLGSPFRKHLFFSPNRTGGYFIRLYHQNSFSQTLTFAILNPDHYQINSSQIIIIGIGYHPIHVLQADLEAGNYSCSVSAVYAKMDRGWNYAAFPEHYGTFPSGDIFYLEAGTYGIIIEESCIFNLSYYPPKNETNPEGPSPDPDNSTDNNSDGGSLLDGVTPVFAVGVLLGILVLFLTKKKKK